METETQVADSDWDYPLTDDELRAIDAALSAAVSAPPIKKCRSSNCSDATLASSDSPATTRRRLPQTLFTFQQRQKSSSSLSSTDFSTNRSYVDAKYSYQEIKFGGGVVYSRTVDEVERAAEELLKFMDISKRKGDQCILGLDIEWRPTFKRGVAPGKVAVMQICVDNNLCHVLHVIHSGIPKNLQNLLEDPSTLKVGVCIANDAAKVLRDYNISVSSLRDLSDVANQKLGGDPKRWSLSMLTESLICRQLPKPSKIRLGNWEAKVLSKEQLDYAATDAYVSWLLYQVLTNLPDPADKHRGYYT
ncbi:Werner Syndrome-like exonuclease [Dorcoceras hygrometricum]|uniref:3'-5' exonuclease n=1 Tax=Dorcoceras hygrometricum TaxID=472368 RepID=A0A2Z7CUU6_9LAMI|nr:Werner Syndrome-like exonuclease [Dorcoceras hygrometricum]